MAYQITSKAHTKRNILQADGKIKQRYSRYESGVITGVHRNINAVLADSTGFDGLGFDASVGSNDDNWYLLNSFDKNGVYVDSIAVGGAFDAAHALQVARSQFDSLTGDDSYSIVLVCPEVSQFDSADCDNGWSIDAISKLLDNPSQNKNYLPIITASELEAERRRVAFDEVQWDSIEGWGLASHGGSDSSLYLDMVRADSCHELINALDLTAELQALGAEEESFDALMETKSRLPLLKDRLFAAMSRVSNDSLSVVNVTQTKPFKRQGVSNIAFVFDLSDGQSVSIWFHNPDSTPLKLAPSDIMISWKWMLNKRDVTAILSPKNGDDVQLPVLTNRIMRVAAKNSKRFKSAQARKLQMDQDITDAEQRISEKNKTIADFDSVIDDLNKKIDVVMKAPKKLSENTINNEVVVIDDEGQPAIGENQLPTEAETVESNQPTQANNSVEDITPIVITGQEIEVGDDVDFKTAKNNAMTYFDNNLKDKVVFCSAIDSDVLLRRRGGKHIAKANHTFREKLQLVAAIPEMIKRGKYGHYTALNKEKGSNIEGYYMLNVDVMVGDDLKAARVVLEKNNEGKVLYDIGINKKEALVALGDTATNKMFDGVTESSQYQSFLDESYQLLDSEVNQFDKMTSNEVILNIFFDDIETETTPSATAQGVEEKALQQSETDMTLGNRLAEIEKLVNSDDFEPNNDLLEELIQIADEVASDEALMVKVNAISEAYQKKLAEISIKALQDMAG